MIEELRKRLDEKRFLHSLGVAKLARETALRFNEDEKKAYIAGLLHDCAKNISFSDSLRLCEEFKIELNEIEKINPALIHAPLGAEIAKRDFKVLDFDIYNAIKNHTVARAGMSKLEKIIYVCDMAEESRNFDGVCEIRDKLFENLDEAVLLALKFSVMFNVQRDKLIHPATIDALNDIKIRREAKWKQ